MVNLQAKVEAVIKSVVTWLTVASVAIAQVAGLIDGLSPAVAQIGASAGAIYVIIRSVKPAAKGERGLAPSNGVVVARTIKE